jgi:hypothetical protein
MYCMMHCTVLSNLFFIYSSLGPCRCPLLDSTQSLKRVCIDDKSVLDVTGHHSLVALVDLVRRGHLDVAHDVVSPAEVQHVLGLLDAPDHGPRDGAPRGDDVEDTEGHGLWGGSHYDELPVGLE